MSDFTIQISGLSNWQRALRSDLGGAINAALTAVAEEGRDLISPYPPAPPRTRDRWYERGYGPRWRRKDGSVGGRKTSETLGRRWTVASKSRTKVALINTASYAGYVHDSQEQAQRMKQIGWRTERDMEQALRLNDLGDEIAKVLEAR